MNHPVLAILGVLATGLSLGGAATPTWENSLGMKFVPVPGTAVQFSIWETRVSDFTAFVAATGHDTGNTLYVTEPGSEKTEEQTGRTWQKPPFSQTPQHPVVGVNWDDAQAFCAWLTRHERAKGIITTQQCYRLPTDIEWSKAAGLTNESGTTPQERFLGIKDLYPWNSPWPPPSGAGNYAQALGVDSFEYTAPVGSFPPNPLGIHDLGGNVAEWCQDWWNDQQKFRVLRSAAWHLECNLCLMTSYRFPNFPTMRMDTYGFRVVLAPADPKP